MISSEEQVILMEKDRLIQELTDVIKAEQTIYNTLVNLQFGNSLYFRDVEVSQRLNRKIISYISALKDNRNSIRENTIRNIRNLNRVIEENKGK